MATSSDLTPRGLEVGEDHIRQKLGKHPAQLNQATIL
jgi:hypothetical protein